MDVFHFCLCLLCCGFSTAPPSPAVRSSGPVSAALHHNATFSCSLEDDTGVKQVTWKRRSRTGVPEDVATLGLYNKHWAQERLVPRLRVAAESLRSVSITLINVTVADEGCYICSFSIYPTGTTRSQSCLTVHGIQDVWTEKKLTWIAEKKLLLLTCSASGRPAPVITWQPWHVANSSQEPGADGMETVSSSITVQPNALHDTYVDCVVSSPGSLHNVSRRIHLTDEEATQDKGSYKVPVVVSMVVVIALVGLAIICRRVISKTKKQCRPQPI